MNQKLKNIIYISVVAITVAAGSVGCNKDRFDINRNINNPTDSTITYDLLLPASLNNTGKIIATDWAYLQNWLGYWARSGTYAPSVTEETYNVTTSFRAGIWTDFYDNLYDYQTMQNAATKNGAAFYAGIARIMKAHNYGLLVDLYNNVPYTEALKGSANSTPKYDKGLDIYKDLLRQVDTGMSLIKNAAVGTGTPNKTIATDDIMFKGDKTLWAKFGNTLKLRLLVHLMNGGILKPQEIVPGIDIPTEIAKITTEGSGFLTKDAKVNPGYTSGKPNPFYGFYVSDPSDPAPSAQNSVYYKANEYAIRYYEYNGDPRESKFYVAGTGGLKGVKYGLPSNTANAGSVLAGIGPGVSGTADSAQRVMTAVEGLFLQAEATHRGFMPGGAVQAKILTNAGITESFLMLGLTSTQAASYISNNAGYGDVDYSAPSLGAGLPGGGLATIIHQKWFALNATATFEVYSDYRRVDFNPPTVNHFVYGTISGFDPGPPISVSPSNTRTEIPVRLLYPQNEYNYNPANVNAQGTIDAFTSKVFWDLK
jgi:hypothetical protein